MNDSQFVVDSNYVHTDNNYTTTEKTKLSGIESGSQVNTVTSVAGKTAVITLTKYDVGLNNVDNTSDLNKPVSTDTQTALDLKVDKVVGKQLSTEDYTTAEKTKLGGIQSGAEVNVNADWNSTSGYSQILNKPSIIDNSSTITNPTVPHIIKNNSVS